jgi:tetratricopeptide (TPR) repeat protein
MHSDIASQPGTAYYRSAAQIGVQVAEALDYAHREGVVHRDIKPSNLLLDTAGQAWVTDFGLAKADDSDDLTHTGDLVGTLRYMAPERFQGKADARADVYGLGITLYEMLTLQPAFDDSQRARLIERVTHEEPPRPRRLDPHVPRDLETVVLKAIAKEPAARYATAAALADDLRRFLADRPVRARRSSAGERFWRWCRRNPAVASLIALVAALLVTVASVATLAAWRTEQARVSDSLARDQADAARHLAEDRAREIRQDFDRLAAANTLLQSGRFHADAGQWAKAHEELTGAIELRRDNAFFWYERGNFYTRLGLWDEAAADYAEAFRLQQQPATPHQAWSHAVLRAWVGDEEGYRQACAALPQRFPEGTYFGEEHKLALAYAQLPASGLDLGWARRVAERAVQRDGRKPENLHALGLTYCRAREYDQAVQRLKESSQVAPGWVGWLGGKGGSLNQLGLALAYQRLGRSEEAQEALADGWAAIDRHTRSLFNSRSLPGFRVWQEWLGALLLYREARGLIDGAPPPDDPRLWVVRGRALAALGLKDQAAAACARAAALAPQDFPIHEACFRLFAELGQLDRAAAEHARAIELRPDDPQVVLQFFRFFAEREDWEKADGELDQVLRERPQNQGLRLAAAQLYSQKGRWTQAVAHYSAALGLLKKDDPRRAVARRGRAEVYLLLKEDDKAWADLRELGQGRPDQPGVLARLGRELAQHLFAAGHYPEAVQAYDQAIKLDPGHSPAWHNRGHCYERLRQWDRAYADFTKAIELNPNEAGFFACRGRAYCAQGRWKEAAADYARVLALNPGREWNWYESAVLRLRTGDVAGYRSACRTMLDRFGNTDNPSVAEQTAKTCSLTPDAVGNFEPVLKLADRALKGRESDRWILLAKVLAEYRAGHPAEAVAWLKRARPRADGGPLDASLFAVLALAQHRLGRPQEARAALADARTLLAQKMPDPRKGRFFGGDWHDWLRTEVLTREAEGLLDAGR